MAVSTSPNRGSWWISRYVKIARAPVLVTDAQYGDRGIVASSWKSENVEPKSGPS